MRGENDFEQLTLTRVFEERPLPAQLYDADGGLFRENRAFRSRFRAETTASAERALVDATHAGRRSALEAARQGHHRALPLGTAGRAAFTAQFLPLRAETDGATRFIKVLYLESELSVAAGSEPTPPPPRAVVPPASSSAGPTSSPLEQELRFILDNVPQLVWSTLPDGYHDFYNRRWYEYIGGSPAETRGGGWNDPLHPDDQQVAWERWQRSLATGEPYEIEYRFRRTDGAYRWFLGRAMPMYDANGTIARWFGTCTDIDDQKRAKQERARVLEKLETVTRLKDEFLASASHELRTPLNAILGWARMQRLRPELTAKTMAVIERNAEAQAALIEDLLDMSRAVAGKMMIDASLASVVDLVHSALDTVRPAASAKRVALVVEDAPAPVAPRMLDPDRIRQVLWNLLSNAVKFTPPAGVVTVRIGQEDAAGVAVAVHDTGKWIAPEFLPFVFDRFRQADSSVTRREGGLGLGLGLAIAIARHLVEMHGGTLSVASGGVGHGSTFTMRLPPRLPDIVPLAPVSSVATPGPGPAGSIVPWLLDGAFILVVDDERDARELLGELLTGYGARVELADSVDAALESVARARPALILSDIGMPERSGLDLVSTLRAGGFRGPAIALTAFTRAEDRGRAIAAGFDDSIAKPPDTKLLIDTIDRLIRAGGDAA